MISEKKMRRRMKRLDDEIKEMVHDQIQNQNTLIDMGWCQIGNDGVYYLTQNIHPSTTMINLYRNSLTDEALLHIRNIPLQDLRFVNISINIIGNIGCKIITNCQWPSLQELELTRCGIDQHGITHLSKGHWTKLELLDLSHNFIGNGVDKLMKGRWKKLKILNLNETALSIRQSLQLCMSKWPKINQLDLSIDRKSLDNRYSIRWQQRKYIQVAQAQQLLNEKFNKIPHLYLRVQILK